MTSFQPLLRAEELGKDYLQKRAFSRVQDTVRAFDGVSFTVQRGARLAIVGESGAGKSSLARCLALLEPPTRGRVFFCGEPVLDLGKKEKFAAHRKIQIIFQNPTAAMNPRFSAEEIVTEPLRIQNIGTRAERHNRALDSMQRVGLPPEWSRKRPMEFSGGQRQRLAIARALVLEPELLILDEALANLDRANQEHIVGLLSVLQMAHSIAYIHISHDLSQVARLADEVAVMHQGNIVEQREAAELLSHPQHFYTQRLVEAGVPDQRFRVRRTA